MLKAGKTNSFLANLSPKDIRYWLREAYPVRSEMPTLVQIVEQCQGDSMHNVMKDPVEEHMNIFYTLEKRVREKRFPDHDSNMVLVVTEKLEEEHSMGMTDRFLSWNVWGLPYNADSTEPEDSNQFYGLEFEPWEDWLSFKIIPENVEEFGPRKYVAYVVWEMSFMGYSEETISNTLDSIVDDAAKVWQDHLDGKN